MSQLRVGIIGLGMMGKQHARVLSNLAGIDFVGAYDPEVKAGAISQYRPVFSSVEELVSKGLDYAVVATPTITHLDIAEELANYKVGALIEKPIAESFEKGRKISEVFSRVGLLGGVGHIERFNPAVKLAQEKIDLIGTIFQISTRRQGPFPGRISDVGVIKDLTTHDIDLTRCITRQEYSKVSAHISFQSGRSHEDLVLACATLEFGTIANHITNWLNPKKERSIVILGEKGSLEIDTLNSDLTFFANGTSHNQWEEMSRFRGVSEGDVIKFAISKREPLVIEHENFRDLFLGKKSQIVSLDEGVKAIEVAERFLDSARGNL